MALRQDRVLGALLGMGIGDALGMPVEGWTKERVVERFGKIDRYHPRGWDDGAQLAPGEFTDESEGVLCIVESFTASSGAVDPENILARLEILARGEARRWMNPGTLAAIDAGPEVDAGSLRVTGDVAARGIPLGLIAAGKPKEGTRLIEEHAASLAQMTHQGDQATAAVATIAEALRVVASGMIGTDTLPDHLRQFKPARPLIEPLIRVMERNDPGTSYDDLAAEIGFGDGAIEVVSTAVLAAASATDFADGVFMAASQGGASDARGAITGALLGGEKGTAGIPQALIDGLEGRMYIMLAAPWFYQTIQLKSSFWRSSTLED